MRIIAMGADLSFTLAETRSRLLSAGIICHVFVPLRYSINRFVACAVLPEYQNVSMPPPFICRTDGVCLGEMQPRSSSTGLLRRRTQNASQNVSNRKHTGALLKPNERHSRHEHLSLSAGHGTYSYVRQRTSKIKRLAMPKTQSPCALKK